MRWISLAALALSAAVRPAGPSNSLLDVRPDGDQLLVANTDGGTVTVVDLEARKAVREIPVGDHPEGVAWVGNGPLAVVTVYRDDKVVFLDTAAGKVVETLKVRRRAVRRRRPRRTASRRLRHPRLPRHGQRDRPEAARRCSARSRPAQWCRGIALSPDEKRAVRHRLLHRAP